ncbi:hypothetical protein AB0L41_47025 [Amycolatopsis mediterranei]|uniref:hypothetical protein n=1 Tax=Amycolatopsis mediterranei TaxID=33910 RepID=UPI00343CEFA5
MVAADGVRPTVHLHTDSFYVWIRTGFVQPHLPEAACGYGRGDYDVVLDGVVGPWALQPFRDTAKRDGLDLYYVVLRPSLEATLARGTVREAKELVDVEPLKGMHAAFGGLGALERNVMDTTEQAAEETADAVRRRARSAAFAL